MQKWKYTIVQKSLGTDPVSCAILKTTCHIPCKKIEMIQLINPKDGELHMICTCDNCHYTFECPELPTRCPDCGKETRSHKVGSRIVSLVCVREATEAEIDCYKRIQRELAEEESQAAATAALADKLMALGDPFSFEDDPYDMPVHEHNFALMLVYYTHCTT